MHVQEHVVFSRRIDKIYLFNTRDVMDNNKVQVQVTTDLLHLINKDDE